MKRKIMLIICSLVLTLSSVLPGFAAECVADKADDVNSVGIVNSDPETGITIYRDSAGGTVVSGVMTPYAASEAEQKAQLEALASMKEGKINSENSLLSVQSNRVDKETNPIYIGTWNGVPCYARHTLGSYNANLRYLTTYGYATWYNTKGYTALPYRNGAANNGSGQNVADVVKGSYFDIRDLTTDRAMNLQVNDRGPDQKQAPDRIVDLDRGDFSELHGNYSAGVFYCRTWVPINNYNPG